MYDRPYRACNFLVDVDGSSVGGFQEMSGIASTALTLKRGIVDARALRQWIDRTLTVTLTLQRADRDGVAMAWTLTDARIVRRTMQPDAATGFVAVEEMVLACDRVDPQSAQ